MTMVGYDYLRTSAQGDYNSSIATADAEGIKRFMCPRSGGNVAKCETCNGLSTCHAGQRAMAIQQQMRNDMERNDMALFQQACSSGSPWGYMARLGLNDGAIRDKLAIWCKRYPGIATKYGGQKQIIKPMRMRVHHEEEKQAEVEGQTEKAAVKEEPKPEPREKTKEETQAKGWVKAAATTREKTAHIIRKALETGNPLKYLMETRGNDKYQAKQTLIRWQKGHPELFEGVEIKEIAKSSGQQEEPKETTAQEEDEISLEAFLAQHTAVEEREETEPQTAAKAEDDGSDADELAQLMEDEAALLRSIAILQKNVAAIRQKRRAIEDKMYGGQS